jgi:hypothetical protein
MVSEGRTEVVSAGEAMPEVSAGEVLSATRHPLAGVYSVWGYWMTPEYLEELPYIHGVQLYAQWAELKPTETDPYQWEILDAVVEDKIGDLEDRALYLQVNACWPEWIYEHVARATFIERDRNPPQFWDPIYIDLYKAFIQDLADHIAQTPYKDKIILVRAQYNAFNAESIYPEGHTSYEDYEPTAGGHRYEVDYTTEMGDDYARQITQAYVDGFSPLGILVVQKPWGSGWESDYVAEEWVDLGVGFFQTNETPNPKYRHNMYQYAKQDQAVRAFSEPYTWSGTEEYESVGRIQVVYWSTLSALHQGIEFISYYGADVIEPEFESVFHFANKYAGWYREPHRSPGAWIAFREMEEHYWKNLTGNFEYLMTQIKPENTIGLYAYRPYHFPDRALNPYGEPAFYMGVRAEKEGIWARQTNGQPIYLDLDDTFAASLDDLIAIRVSFFDQGDGEFRLMFNDENGELQTYTFSKCNTMQWREVKIVVGSYQFANSLEENADILLDNAGDDEDIFHMVEVTRYRTAYLPWVLL